MMPVVGLQEEGYSHECNQRMTTLYGVGKGRDEARHVLKKMSKEVMKLFSKKNSHDISDGSKNKKKREKETEIATNYEAIFNKFQK